MRNLRIFLPQYILDASNVGLSISFVVLAKAKLLGWNPVPRWY
ncbi:hypothetical protein [Sphingomonas bacterium]|nr:hypothetical protein [Sphingomonas bacterium]